MIFPSKPLKVTKRMSPSSSFKATLTAYQKRVESALEQWLPAESVHPQQLHKGMRYATLNGGKRIRPVLVYATGHALDATIDRLDGPACAVELIHAYSLVHDDLPAMDDDDLRRGVPTCHKAFDEATAILVGDALQTLAFQVLCDDQQIIDYEEKNTRIKMVSTLAQASGAAGMVGGQAIDLAAVGNHLTQAELEMMHMCKTGALIQASVLLGAYAAGESNPDTLQKLKEYARCVGLAFQVRDDILDIEGDAETIGKPQGSDIAKNKPTYPALLGMDGAKKIAEQLHQKAMAQLADFGQNAQTLRDLSAYIVKRDN